MFRMTKLVALALEDFFRLHIPKKDTHYRLEIPLEICVACTFFKLTHGACLVICLELFAVDRITVSSILRNIVHATNDVLQPEIAWPQGHRLLDAQLAFKRLCGLHGVVGAIDGMHVHISKPTYGPQNYFYFKFGDYSMNCQAIVDSNKKFLDLNLGMSGSTNDSHVL